MILPALAGILLSLVALPTWALQCINTDQPTFYVNDTATSNTLMISLQNAPVEPITFQLTDYTSVTSNGIVCETYQLTFTVANWNVPQPLVCHGTGIKAQGINQGTLAAVIPFQLFTSHGFEYCRDVDPTFMWVVRSQALGLFVQTRHYNCGPGVTCIDTLAVQYEGSIVFVTIWPNAQGVITPKVTYPLGSTRGELEVYYNNVSGSGYAIELRFFHGAQISITAYYWPAHKTWYSNVNFIAPPSLHKEQRVQPVMGGLFGNYDDNKDNDLTVDPEWTIPGFTYGVAAGTGAASTTTVGKFAGNFRVAGTSTASPGDVLFYRCCTADGTSPDPQRSYLANTTPDKTNPAVFYPQSQAKTPGYTKVTSFVTSQVCAGLPAIVPFKATRRDAVTDAFIAKAQENCEAAISGTGCESLVSSDTFVSACVLDASLSGTLDFIDSHKNSYFQSCANSVRSVNANFDQFMKIQASSSDVQARDLNILGLLSTTDGDSTNPLDLHDLSNQIAQELGLGKNDCIDNCNFVGTCVNHGCLCKPGYTGVACEIQNTVDSPSVLNRRRRGAEL
ncbi:hypothetical protein HDU76_000392 [Blyttiomyces sp. JEL0837]|nr:hypothetical protein HDU76_000392 [Blyttiomyces sp. JEL0837]